MPIKNTDPTISPIPITWITSYLNAVNSIVCLAEWNLDTIRLNKTPERKLGRRNHGLCAINLRYFLSKNM